MKCIFCEEDLTAQTKPEHILLSALGGRKSTRTVDCSHHNEIFGSTIDDELAQQVRVIRNMLQLESGTRKPPPGLRSIKAGDEFFNFDSEGQPTLASGKPFTITRLPNGTYDIEVTAKDAEHLKSIIPHIAAATKMSEQQVESQLQGGTAQIISRRPGVVHHRLSFGGEGALRSIVKSALVLWTLSAGNDELRSDPYAEARNYVLSGGNFNVSRIRLDSRPIPGTDELTNKFGNFFNQIYVASDAVGRVVAHFTLYNMIGWQVVLAESGGRTSDQIGIINNPLNPKDWSDTIATDAPIPFEWLANPTYADDFARARERVSSMAKKHIEDANSSEMGKIIREVFKKNGIVENTVILDDQLKKKVFGEIALRVALHQFNMPYVEQLTPEDIEKLLHETEKK